jgi:hypothetical protein
MSGGGPAPMSSAAPSAVPASMPDGLMAPSGTDWLQGMGGSKVNESIGSAPAVTVQTRPQAPAKPSRNPSDYTRVDLSAQEPSPSGAPEGPRVGMIASRGGRGGASAGARGNQRAILDTFSAQEDAMGRGVQAESDGARDQSAALGQMSVDTMMAEQEEKDRMEARRKVEDEGNQKLAKLQEAANKDIDPKRAWNNASDGTKAVTYIAAALAGFAQGLSGENGPNPVWERIDRLIDRDIAAQEKDLGTAQGAVDNQKGMLSVARQQFDDETQARAAARDLYYQSMQQKLQSLVAGTQSETVKANGEQMISELERKRLATQEQFRAQNARTAQTKTQYIRYVDGLPVAMSADQFMKQSNVEADRRSKGEAEKGSPEELRIPGLAGQASSKESAKKMREVEIGHKNITGLIDEARKIRKEVGGEAFPTKEKARLQAINASLDLAFKEQANLGVMSDSDWQVVRRAIPDLTRWDTPWSTKVDDHLAELKNTAQRSRTNAARSYGFEVPEDKLGFKPER